jgi:uncharacterized protein YqgC (DUF456 family)
MDIALWILALLLIAAGLAGTVLPAVPGVPLIFAGLLLAAWIDGFTRIGTTTVIVFALLAALAWAVEYLAALAGAKRAGASPQALVGAALGTVAGVFSGLWGLLFMPLLGAAAGEYLARRDLPHAGRVGFATWLGMLAGTVLKVAIAFLMVGVFVAALLF